MEYYESDVEDIKARIVALELEHRDLDAAISVLLEKSYIDQLQMQRMKKRKLSLKDSIARLESMLIPDLPA